MRTIAVADCETDPFKEGRTEINPFIWGFFDGDTYMEFSDPVTSTDDFIAYVRERDIILYAHNGGKFDWHFILKHLMQFDPIMVISGRIAKFRIGQCEFRDSYNILPIPLGAYNKDDIDYAIMEADRRYKPENWRKIREYLKSDCVYLHEMVSRFVQDYGSNLTLAGAALNQWRKIAKQKTPKTTRAFYEYFSEYYYGGRVQCFQSGIIERDFKVIDINSAYPFAMNSLHPFGSVYSRREDLPKTEKYIARCFIELTCISRGALPYRDAIKGKLTFPDDGIRRTFKITGHEYLAALRTETISDVVIISVTQFADSISFVDYVKRFYALKNTAKAAEDALGYLFAKLFLNSLYGKFGANPEKYREYEVIESHLINLAENAGFQYHAQLGPWTLVSKPLDEEKQHYINVATAASITGYVRAYLWESICQCRDVIYCDTDSIVCGDPGRLYMDKSEIGAWDIEADCDYGAVAGKKLYAFRTKSGEWKTASKGVRLTAEQIVKVAKGETVTYTPIAPSFSVANGIRFISRKIVKSV